MSLKVTIILLETSLETIPSPISKHPSVLRDAEKRRKDPGKILLDDSLHHQAIASLKDGKKRGRPDIAHFCLISALDSRLSDYMNIYVHTINNDLIWINNKTRLPRNYNRFKGLIEKLFEERVIRNEEVLLKIVDKDLGCLLSSLKGIKILMSGNGEKDEDFFSKIKQEVVVCIGGFPHGNFSKETLRILNENSFVKVSLGKESFTSNYVMNKVICILENLLKEKEQRI
ncbi:MAG TPA: 16S rRNA methyltransferase [Archaeoglobaceae archaeon]|nr:16S rRNA methyltransferase [Archaeoglobaceae archaeon]